MVNMNDFLFYFLLFISYSFLGWIIEVVSCSITEKRLCINRGFLVGPYLPIFGLGSIIIIVCFSRYKDDLLALFIISMVSLTALEYFTSFLMEKIFHARWWSYEKRKYNINGRVSLIPALGFGILSVILLKIINPTYIYILNKIPKITLGVISIVLLIIFITDLIISSIIIFSLRKKINSPKKDVTEEVNREVKKILKAKTSLTNRLEKAFPNAKYNEKNKKSKFI